MSDTKKELVNYRLERAHDTLEDAEIWLNEVNRNSAINRLY